MKTIKFIPVFFLGIIALSSCVSEEDQQLPVYNPVIYNQDFQALTNGEFDDSIWVNVATKGSKIWKSNVHKGNGYYEFSPFQSNENENEAWLIMPKINISDANSKNMIFKVAQHHVTDTTNNNLKVFISTDFSGKAEDVATATWVEKKINLPKAGSSNHYKFISSGKIDLSEFSGEIFIGFRAIGGSANDRSGSYQIDDIKIF